MAGSPSTAGRATRSWGSLGSLAAWTPVLALAAFSFAAVDADLAPSAVARALAAIAFTQVLPGALLWRTVRPRSGWWFEDVTMGFALGLALSVATQAVAGWTGASWLSVVTGPAVAVGLLVASGSRSRISSARTSPLPWGWGPAVAGVSMILLRDAVALFRTLPLNRPEFMSPYVDMPFHIALAGQLAHRGPTSFPHVAGEELAYHWFSHAWVAQIGQASGVELDAILYRVVPVVVPLALVALVAVAATRISGRPWAGPLAALLATTAGVVSVVRRPVPLELLHHLSPSLGVASVVVVALITLLACRWRGHMPGASAVLVVVLGTVAAGIKGSALPVVTAGAVFAAAAAFLLRFETRRRVGLDAALLASALVGALIFLFDGSAQELDLDPASTLERIGAVNFLVPDGESATLWAIILALLLLLGGVLAIGAGLLAAYTLEDARTDPVMFLLLGTALAGTAAVGLLSHLGGSQSYFLRNAAPALALGSAVGLAALWRHMTSVRLRAALASAGVAAIWWFAIPWLVGQTRSELSPPARAGIGTALLVGLLVGGALLASHQVHARRRLLMATTAAVALCLISITPRVVRVATPPALPEAAESVPSDARNAFSGDQIEAARWLRDHSGRTELVMTNRHCANPRAANCDSRRFFVAAYTERQVLVEGWAYTPTAVALSVATRDTAHAYVPYWKPDVLHLNDAFLQAPTRDQAQQLWDRGVRWLFIDKVVEHTSHFGDLAHLRHETDHALVFELAPPDEPGSPR